MQHTSRTGTLSSWIRLARIPFFTASIIPVLVGALWALEEKLPAQWPLLAAVLACAVLLHAATNMVSDYFDFIKGVDTKTSLGSSRVLVEGLLAPRQALTGGIMLFGAGFLLGLIIVAVRGLPILLLGVLGILGGFCYTGRPVGFKYKALGDLGVFLLMGPLLVIASFYSLTGILRAELWYLSLPIGLLVTAILHANNLRDINYDSAAGIHTLESIMGFHRAKNGYYLMVSGAYAAVAIMAYTGMLSFWALSVFLSAPLAIKNISLLAKSPHGDPQDFPSLDILTAQLHLAFGLLFITALLIQALSR